MALTLHGTVANNTAVLSRPNAKPLIINGDMKVAQRATSLTGVSATAYTTIDRMKFTAAAGGTYTMSQNGDVPAGYGFAISKKFDVTTAKSSLDAGSIALLDYRVEAQDLRILDYGTAQAKTITLAFWIKSPKTGTHIVHIYQHDGARHISKAYTVSSANTWEKQIVTIPGDTGGTINNDNGIGFQIQWGLCAGSTFSSGTLATSWAGYTNSNSFVGQVNCADNTSNNIFFTGIQLEVGEFDANSIPPFQHESYADNLQRCKRYCQSTFSQGEAIGSATAVGIIITCATGTAIGRVATGHQFPVSFRAPPTIVIHNQTGGTTGSGRNGDTGALISMSAGNASTCSIHFENSATFGNDGAQMQFQFSATSELQEIL